jgi:hypothetical protein
LIHQRFILDHRLSYRETRREMGQRTVQKSRPPAT